jgi:hypothetical protein
MARMPSMRSHGLNPRAPAAPAKGAGTSTGKPPREQDKPAAPAAADAERAADKATQAGGFHESSYELQSGLMISESEWPDDVTIPGALDDH